MIVHRLVQFTTDLPDDSIEGEDDYIQWPGKGVAVVVAEMLTRHGYNVEGPEDLEHRGWELYFTAGKRKFAVRISEVHTFVVEIYPRGWFAETRGKKWPEYIAAQKNLHAELTHDPRFHNIRWFDDYESDLNKPGAPCPVEE